MKILRFEHPNDNYIRKIVEIERQCFSYPNSEKQISADIANENADIFVAIDNDILCGYVGLHYVLDEGYMDNLAVDSSCRRCGIASALLSALDSFANEKSLSFITLEVRESNFSAQMLYEKNGYVLVGKRKSFYRSPNEDALLMTKYY